eukprot:scaffold65299_cov33-Tisochrysis_lutea.AAC.2
MLVIARLALGAPTVYSDGTVTRVRRPTQPWQVAKGIWAEEPARPSHTSKRKGPGAAYQIGVASRPRPSNGVVVEKTTPNPNIAGDGVPMCTPSSSRYPHGRSVIKGGWNEFLALEPPTVRSDGRKRRAKAAAASSA